MDPNFPAELEPYRGKRLAIQRGLGDLGWLRLHQAFEGNATAAAQFLGFSGPGQVIPRWAKLGIAPLGREAPRRGYQQWPERSAADWLAAYRTHSREQEAALECDWGLPTGAVVGILVPICDLHWGHIGCDCERLLELIEWLKRHSHARWFLGGDNLDVDTTQSPGKRSEQFMPLDAALDSLELALRPIVGQGLAVGDGNHEARIERATDTPVSPSKQLAERLGLPFFGLHAHLLHRVGEQTYQHFHHHGVGAAATEGGKVNMALRVEGTVVTDIVTVGHAHFEVALKRLRREVQPDLTVANKQTRVVMCPSFLQYRGYPADKALRPSSLGVLSLHLGAKAKRDIRVVE